MKSFVRGNLILHLSNARTGTRAFPLQLLVCHDNEAVSARYYDYKNSLVVLFLSLLLLSLL